VSAPSLVDVDHALLSLVAHFRGTLVRLLKSGLPGRRALREVTAALVGEEAEAPGGWEGAGPAPRLYHLARALGLLAAERGTVRVDGARATAYFLAPAADRVRQRVRAWRGVTTWSELCDLPGLDVDRGARARAHGAPDGHRAARARAAVYDQVAALPAGDWTPVAEVVASALDVDPTLLFPAETGPYYPGVTSRRAVATRVPRRPGVPLVEEAFVLRVLRLLTDLGAAELSEDEDALRPTPAGLYALGTGPRPETPSPTGGELVVQPTCEVVVLSARTDVSLVFTLERFAVRTGPGPGTTYRFDEESVYRAVREGLEVPAILAFLEAHAGTGVPDTVAFTLRDWARRQERIRILRQAAVLEFPDPASLDAHLVAMDLAGTGARRVGERWVLVPRGDRRTVTRCLGQNYFTDLDYAATLPPCLELSPDLEVRELPERSRIDLDRLLGRFTERDADGRRRITPESLRGAPEQGLSAPAVVELVEELAVGGAPAALRELAEAAAGGLGPVAVGPVSALVADNPAELARLLELDVVSRRLLRVAGGGVALVEPGSEDALREAMDRLGVPLDPGLLERRSTTAEPVRTARQVRALLDQALDEGREVVIRFDPGARRPLQDLRVEPLRIEVRNGIPSLVARQRGRNDPRRFSLKFVSGVRLLGR